MYHTVWFNEYDTLGSAFFDPEDEIREKPLVLKKPIPLSEVKKFTQGVPRNSPTLVPCSAVLN